MTGISPPHVGPIPSLASSGSPDVRLFEKSHYTECHLPHCILYSLVLLLSTNRPTTLGHLSSSLLPPQSEKQTEPMNLGLGTLLNERTWGFCFISTTILRGAYSHYFHFTEEETGSQRDLLTCPRSHSPSAVGLECRLKLF